MKDKQADRFEKHRKEARKKAFLNLAIVFLFTTGLGFYISGYMLDFLLLVASLEFAVLFSGMLVGSMILLWGVPMFHYREDVVAESDREPEYYMERDLGEEPLVEVLEKRGWNEKEADEDKVVLETYPTFFHRVLSSKTALSLEREQKDDLEEELSIKSEGEDIMTVRTEYEEKGGGTTIKETTVSEKRVSPVYLEVTAFLEPDLQRLMEDAAQHNLAIQKEDIDFALSRSSLEE